MALHKKNSTGGSTGDGDSTGGTPTYQSPVPPTPTAPASPTPTPTPRPVKVGSEGWINNMKSKYDEFTTQYPDEASITPAAVEKFARENGLTAAEKLYLCEMIAHNDTDFTAEGTTTWCNGYAAYVLYLYKGSEALMSDEADPTKNHNFHDPHPGKGEPWWTLTTKNDPNYEDMNDVLADTGTWQVVDAETAQKLANQGSFVVAFKTGHIAVVSPGQSKVSYGVTCPAIAQQGKSNLLYGVTSTGHASNGWGEAVTEVKYYVLTAKK
jgi:hypothetical protein